MARVGKTEYSWNGEYQRFPINCSSRGDFTIKLPDSIHEKHGDSHVRGTTLGKVENEFINLLDKYSKESTERTKKIIYKISSGKFMSQEGGFGLKVGFYVIYEEKSLIEGENPCYRYINPAHAERTEPGGYVTISGGQFFGQPDSKCVDYDLKPNRKSETPPPFLIDWTQDRENFFVDLGDRLVELKTKLDTFLSDPVLLIAQIERGCAGLLGAPRDKEDGK